ncbi:MAG: hypothetical protein OEL75_04160, partial [Kiritimatiellaceae bacterium]|nr:hypothetical protein [Kiritimatiellaceae bacterium]
EQSTAPIKHVLGNHDFHVEEGKMEAIPSLLGLRRRYYDFRIKHWRFVVLDGNGYGVETWPKDHPNHLRANKILDKLRASRSPNANPWNGAIDEFQMSWLSKTLTAAEQNGEQVLLCCHFPVLPTSRLTLWNDQAVLDLIKPFSCVKGWFNGHLHAGDYALRNGVHFVTFRGMVETAASNAFALVSVYSDHLHIQGFGREPDRILPLT